MPKTALCIKISKNEGQKTIALANNLGLFDKSLKIQRDQTSLCIPIIRQPDAAELAKLKNEVQDYQLVTITVSEKNVQTETLTQAIQDKLPSQLLKNLPKALDIIGDIAIVEIPTELVPYQSLVGQAILRTHRNVKTVLAKASAISGAYRVRNLTFISGENKTRTIHKEFGCQYHVDVARAYFSPRLSHEHERITSLVQSGETVIDLFAGVGPFSVLIGKRISNVKVYAVDLNPDAVELLKGNVRTNRVENRVFPILADARQISRGKLKGVANRVIMNLPETAIEFIDAASQAIEAEGGLVHFYAFVRSPDSIEDLKHRFCKAVEASGRMVETFLYAKSIRETAPFESQVVLDAKIV